MQLLSIVNCFGATLSALADAFALLLLLLLLLLLVVVVVVPNLFIHFCTPEPNLNP
jgi:hypothetical protein